jgi:hypothetical protein
LDESFCGGLSDADTPRIEVAALLAVATLLDFHRSSVSKSARFVLDLPRQALLSPSARILTVEGLTATIENKPLFHTSPFWFGNVNQLCLASLTSSGRAVAEVFRDCKRVRAALFFSRRFYRTLVAPGASAPQPVPHSQLGSGASCRI